MTPFNFQLNSHCSKLHAFLQAPDVKRIFGDGAAQFPEPTRSKGGDVIAFQVMDSYSSSEFL